MQKRSTSNTRLRTEALVCKVSEKYAVSAREKKLQKEGPLIRGCVPRHSVGGCSKKERTSNLLIKARNTLNFLTFIFYFPLYTFSLFTITYYFQNPKGICSEE